MEDRAGNETWVSIHDQAVFSERLYAFQVKGHVCHVRHETWTSSLFFTVVIVFIMNYHDNTVNMEF